MTTDSSTGSAGEDVDLGGLMSEVARTLQGSHGDVGRTLEAIAAAAVTSIRNAEHCGISYLVGRTAIEPRAATGELPARVDALQERLGQGPCMSAVRDQRVIRVDDVSVDVRWPEFARAVADLGVGSMICFPLFVARGTLGALNMYSSVRHAFGSDADEAGELFASHAAIALAGSENEQQLRAGLDNRDLVGQAKGILMERYKVTGPEAFTLLAQASNRANVRLVDIAGELTSTGVWGAVTRP